MVMALQEHNGYQLRDRLADHEISPNNLLNALLLFAVTCLHSSESHLCAVLRVTMHVARHH